MNNCESDSIRFWRAIIQSNNELLEQYNSLYNKLSELLALLESCCEDKNDLYNEIIQQLDTLIQNLIDCCKAICDRLDDIIDILIDPIPTSLIGYEIVFKDHICYQNDEDDYPEAWEVGYDNHTCEETETWPPEDVFWLIEYDEHTCEVREPFIPETEWRVEYGNHTCYIEDEDWPLIGYNLEYSNHVCENVWECDVEGEIIDITEDEVSIEYDGLFTDFTCVLYEGQDSFGSTSIIGEGLLTIEAEGPAVTTTTTEEPALTTTTTEEPALTTTTTEEPTATTTTTLEIPPFINSGTRIFIYFDSSGSMAQTLQPLLDMRNGNLKAALLPYYNNNEALYDEMVQVVSNNTERTLHMLNWLAADMPDGNVISLVFQDEASPTYHSTAIEPRTAQFDADLSALRTRLDLFTETEYRGVVFQVATPSSNNVEFFQPFLLAVKDGTGEYAGTNGLSDIPNVNVVCNVASGITYASNPTYYLNLILGALNETIEFCTLDLNGDPFVFNVSVAASQSVTLPFTSTGYYNATVDYGDGSGVLPITAYNDANATHIYASAGDYDISIRGYIHGFSVNNNTAFRSIVNEVKSWGDLRIRKLDFYGCNNLGLIPNESLPSTLVDISNFNRGTSIVFIPSGLFDNNINVTSFTYAFLGCTGLTSIPADLFRYNVNVSTSGFYGTFLGCTNLTSIPADLFRYNVNVSTSGFYQTFYGCTGLTSIPTDLFRHNTLVSTFGFYQTFYGCTGLTSIPADLFRYNVNVSTSGFYGTFYNCSSLTSIPTDLFRHNTLVSTFGFYQTFRGCSSVTSIPTDLFRHNTLVSTFGFYQTFRGCSSVTSIPADLFRHNTLVSTSGFYQTFYNCSSLTSIPTDLFRYNTLVSISGFYQTFYGCSSLTSIPTDLFRHNTLVSTSGFFGTFYGCTNLTSIPADLFRYNVNVSTNGFYQTFYDCTKLQLNKWIFFASGEEGTRFLNKVSTFYRCFYRTSFTGTQGEAPELWNCDFGTETPTKTGCFEGSGNSLTSLSNYNDIPNDWK